MAQNSQQKHSQTSPGIKLVQRNYIPSMWWYTFISCLLGLMVFNFTGDWLAIYWCISLTTYSIFCQCFYKFVIKRIDTSPPDVTITVVILLTLHSSIYSYLLWAFIPSASSELVLALTVSTTSLAAGSVALAAPFILGFYASCIPSMMALICSLFMRGEPIYFWISIGCAILLLGLTFFARVISFTIDKSVDLAQRNKSLVKELRGALIQTDEANRAKSVFLASASHDLRQPLHALGLLTETLGGTSLSSHQSEIQTHMMSAVDSTRTMLDSLLNISKLDAGAISSHPTPFLVQSIFTKLEAELAPTADENGLVYRTRDTIFAAISDTFIVEMILRNLIANAIRYTNEGGLLVACRNRKPNRLSIEVWDTGIGIPKENRDAIFGEFQQLDNPERDAKKGFGLGLAIAQGLARTIGTKICVSSIKDKGSVFRFELRVSDVEVIEDIPKNLPPIDFSGQTVLIIDDDERVRASMTNLLQSWGCKCIAAESAAHAIASVANKKIDIMLVDYRLREGRTGRQAISRLRDFMKSEVPAIIITGDTGSDRIIEAQAVDALLLHKPASTSQLQRMMRSLIDRSKTHVPSS